MTVGTSAMASSGSADTLSPWRETARVALVQEDEAAVGDVEAASDELRASLQPLLSAGQVAAAWVHAELAASRDTRLRAVADDMSARVGSTLGVAVSIGLRDQTPGSLQRIRAVQDAVDSRLVRWVQPDAAEIVLEFGLAPGPCEERIESRHDVAVEGPSGTAATGSEATWVRSCESSMVGVVRGLGDPLVVSEQAFATTEASGVARESAGQALTFALDESQLRIEAEADLLGKVADSLERQLRYVISQRDQADLDPVGQALMSALGQGDASGVSPALEDAAAEALTSVGVGIDS